MDTISVMKPWLGREEAEAATAAVLSGWVAQGPRVAEFERLFAERVGGEHAIAVSSCTAALHLEMVLLGLGPGDEVVVPSLSFIATANCVPYVGATPVFADVDERTQNITAETIAQVMTPATRAVLVVHQAGIPADIHEIHGLCSPRGIAVVEDAACAIGATYKGSPIGQHSEMVAFSFHPRKLVTTGEGGMLVCRDPEVGIRARRLREHAMSVSAADRHSSGKTIIEQYLETGYNYRLTDVQAAIGIVQLARLDEMIERRRQIADKYKSAFRDIPGLITADDPPYGTTNYQSFWLLLPSDANVSRDNLLSLLLKDGISARRGIMASHLEPAYRGHPCVPLPVTEQLTRNSVILPLFHELSQDDQETVIASVRQHLGVAARV